MKQTSSRMYPSGTVTIGRRLWQACTGQRFSALGLFMVLGHMLLVLPALAQQAKDPASGKVENSQPVAAPPAGGGAATGAPVQAIAESCVALSDKAMAADLRAATAQSGREEIAKQSQLVDQSIALWTEAVEKCEGRAQERAKRNLADSRRSRQALDSQLGVGQACSASHKDANSLQELAQQAVRERRWEDASVYYRKAETMWEVAAERCQGDLARQAVQRREQTAVDGHNAEFCAPVFERARDQSQQLRRLGPDLQTAARQTHSQAAETLWREAMNQCKGPALDMARSNAQNLARDRGTPWVATAVPVAAGAAPAVARTVADSAQAVVAAKAGNLPDASGARVPAPEGVKVAAAEPVAPAGPREMDITSGSTRFIGSFILEGNDLTGLGVIHWSNGDKYKGDIVRNRRHGQGSFQWGNGQQYTGSWVNDEARGKGVLVFNNRDRYEGEVLRGVPEGQGSIKYASGDEYQGNFVKGRPEGKGRFKWVNGQTYDGALTGGVPHGHGRLNYASGDSYEGAFVQGVPQGEGRFRWLNGDTYVGQWQRGRKHGAGRLEWGNGDRWEGMFQNDEQTSDGKLIRKAG